MAQRYRRQIGEDRPAAVFENTYPVAGVEVGAGTAAMGQGLQKIGAFLQKRQEEHDAASVLNAQVEYDRRMTELLGGMTRDRLLGAANGMTDEVWTQGDDVAREIAGRLQNQAQRAAFLKIAGQKKMPYWKQASEHEARQHRAFVEQSVQAGLQNAASRALTGGLDTLADAQAEQENILQAFMIGASKEAIKRAVAEQQSATASSWVTRMALEDPEGALALLGDERLKLLPETRLKLEAKIKPEAEAKKVYRVAEAYWDQFGAASPEAREAIYGFDGLTEEQKDKVWSRMKARQWDEERTLNKAQAETQKKQQENYSALVKRGYLDFEFPDRVTLEGMVRRGEIDSDQARRIENMGKIQANAVQMRKHLSTQPGWNRLTPLQQDEAVMRRMPDGPTDEERLVVIGALTEMALNKDVNDKQLTDEIQGYYLNGRLTTNERNQLLGLRKGITEAQRSFVSLQTKTLNSYLAQLFDRSTTYNLDKNAVKSVGIEAFSKAINELDPTQKDYRQKVKEAVRTGLLAAMGKANDMTANYSYWQNHSSRVMDEFYMDYMNPRVEEFVPVVRADNVDLSKRTESVGFDMLGNHELKVTSEFRERRTRKDGSEYAHGGMDIAGDGIAGRTVTAPWLDVEMTVSGVGWDKTSGNKLTLTGERDGKSFKIFICHFEDDSIQVKDGDIVSGGRSLARVGGTGHATGPHLHVETWVGGEKVDPRDFYKELGMDKPKEKKAAEQRQPPQDAAEWMTGYLFTGAKQ